MFFFARDRIDYALVDYIVSRFRSIICKRKLAVIFREETMIKKHWIGQSVWTLDLDELSTGLNYEDCNSMSGSWQPFGAPFCLFCQ